MYAFWSVLSVWRDSPIPYEEMVIVLLVQVLVLSVHLHRYGPVGSEESYLSDTDAVTVAQSYPHQEGHDKLVDTQRMPWPTPMFWR